MTTAARPTFNPAIGRQTHAGHVTSHRSQKSGNSHTQLKFRQIGQSAPSELFTKDYREDIDTKEYSQLKKKNEALMFIENEEKKIDVKLLLTNKPDMEMEKLKKYDELDADVAVESDDGFQSSSDESEDEEDDDELELQAELERIKQERLEAQAKKLMEEKELEDKLKRDNAMKADPAVLIGEHSAQIKRRWNDDVIFRNQAKDEPDTKKRFINDTVRSDFHRSFLKKFIK